MTRIGDWFGQFLPGNHGAAGQQQSAGGAQQSDDAARPAQRPSAGYRSAEGTQRFLSMRAPGKAAGGAPASRPHAPIVLVPQQDYPGQPGPSALCIDYLRQAADRLIDPNGNLDRAAIARLQQELKAQAMLPERFRMQLDRALRQLASDRELAALVSGICRHPARLPKGAAADMVKATLGLPRNVFLNAVHARKAVLMALLGELRQEGGVPQFAAAPASCLLHDFPREVARQLQSLLEKGRLRFRQENIRFRQENMVCEVPLNARASRASAQVMLLLRGDGSGTHETEGGELRDFPLRRTPAMRAALASLGIAEQEGGRAISNALRDFPVRADGMHEVSYAQLLEKIVAQTPGIADQNRALAAALDAFAGTQQVRLLDAWGYTLANAAAMDRQGACFYTLIRATTHGKQLSMRPIALLRHPGVLAALDVLGIPAESREREIGRAVKMLYVADGTAYPSVHLLIIDFLSRRYHGKPAENPASDVRGIEARITASTALRGERRILRRALAAYVEHQPAITGLNDKTSDLLLREVCDGRLRLSAIDRLRSRLLSDIENGARERLFFQYEPAQAGDGDFVLHYREPGVAASRAERVANAADFQEAMAKIVEAAAGRLPERQRVARELCAYIRTADLEEIGERFFTQRPFITHALQRMNPVVQSAPIDPDSRLHSPWRQPALAAMRDVVPLLGGRIAAARQFERKDQHAPGDATHVAEFLCETLAQLAPALRAAARATDGDLRMAMSIDREALQLMPSAFQEIWSDGNAGSAQWMNRRLLRPAQAHFDKARDAPALSELLGELAPAVHAGPGDIQDLLGRIASPRSSPRAAPLYTLRSVARELEKFCRARRREHALGEMHAILATRFPPPSELIACMNRNDRPGGDPVGVGLFHDPFSGRTRLCFITSASAPQRQPDERWLTARWEVATPLVTPQHSPMRGAWRRSG